MKDYKQNNGSKTLYSFTEKRYDDFRKAISEAERNTGEIYDNATGLYYLNARYCDPRDGIFVTQDT